MSAGCDARVPRDTPIEMPSRNIGEISSGVKKLANTHIWFPRKKTVNLWWGGIQFTDGILGNSEISCLSISAIWFKISKYKLGIRARYPKKSGESMKIKIGLSKLKNKNTIGQGNVVRRFKNRRMSSLKPQLRFKMAVGKKSHKSQGCMGAKIQIIASV